MTSNNFLVVGIRTSPEGMVQSFSSGRHMERGGFGAEFRLLRKRDSCPTQGLGYVRG